MTVMATGGLPVIAVAITLAEHREPLADRLDHLVGAVSDRIRATAETLGLPADVETTVTTTAVSGSIGDHSLAIRVNGARCRFPAGLPGVAAAAAEAAPAPADGWSTDPAAPLPFDHPQFAEVIALSCAEAVRLKPSVLLTPEVIDAYTQGLRQVVPELSATSTRPDRMREILAPVLDRGISVADLDRVGRSVREYELAGRDAAVEALIGALDRISIGLLVPPEMTTVFRPGDTESSDLVEFLESGMFEETGVILPRVVIEPAELHSGMFAARINDLTTLPERLIPADRCLVNDTPERLQQMGYSGEPATNPATAKPASLVPLSCKVELEALGLTTWTQAEHVILHLAAVIRRNIGAFVTRDRTLAQIETLEEYFPHVVRAARGTLPAERLTTIIRRLATSHVRLRDLASVLERFVDLPADALDWERYSVLADPVYASPRDPSASDDDDAVENFVRTGLRHQIGQQFASNPRTLVCYLLDADTEAIIGSTNRSEADEDEVLDAIAAKLATLPATALTPVLLTTALIRSRLEDVVRTTYPLLNVLSFADLPSTMMVQPVARIAVQEQKQEQQS